MLKIGDYVSIKNTNLKGFIISKCKNRNYIVNVNDKQVITNENSLINLNKEKSETINKNSIRINVPIKSDNFSDELMIRHQTLEEALFNLDQYLSDAIYHNCKKVKIIHGKHGGILRKGVHEYLKSSPYIKDFHLGNYFEGSYGVTIVYLK